MSAKNNLVYQLLSNQSLSASFNSPPTVIRNLDNCSYQINATTTNSQGTFQVQVSNDYFVNEANGNTVENLGTWVPLTLAGGVPTVSAADTDISIALTQLPFYAVRLAYISTTPGTGICDIFVTDKRLS